MANHEELIFRNLEKEVLNKEVSFAAKPISFNVETKFHWALMSTQFSNSNSGKIIDTVSG